MMLTTNLDKMPLDFVTIAGEMDTQFNIAETKPTMMNSDDNKQDRIKNANKPSPMTTIDEKDQTLARKIFKTKANLQDMDTHFNRTDRRIVSDIQDHNSIRRKEILP